jgi:hypothetical protein
MYELIISHKDLLLLICRLLSSENIHDRYALVSNWFSFMQSNNVLLIQPFLSQRPELTEEAVWENANRLLSVLDGNKKIVNDIRGLKPFIFRCHLHFDEQSEEITNTPSSYSQLKISLKLSDTSEITRRLFLIGLDKVVTFDNSIDKSARSIEIFSNYNFFTREVFVYDPYLLKNIDLLDFNLLPILDKICECDKQSLRITIVIPSASFSLEYDAKGLEKVLDKFTGYGYKNSKIHLLYVPNGPFHDRFIYSNTLSFNSGDSIKYLGPTGGIQTKGTRILLSSMLMERQTIDSLGVLKKMYINANRYLEIAGPEFVRFAGNYKESWFWLSSKYLGL